MQTHSARSRGNLLLIYFRSGLNVFPGSVPRGVCLNSKLADIDSLAAHALIEEPADLGKAIVVFILIRKIAKVCRLQLSECPDKVNSIRWSLIELRRHWMICVDFSNGIVHRIQPTLVRHGAEPEVVECTHIPPVISTAPYRKLSDRSFWRRDSPGISQCLDPYDIFLLDTGYREAADREGFDSGIQRSPLR